MFLNIFTDDVSTDSDNENPYESLYENPDAIDDIDSFDSDSDEDGLHHSTHARNGQVTLLLVSLSSFFRFLFAHAQ